MQQGDIIRGTVWIAAAGVGAGLALAGAALTGHLDGATTIQQISSAPPTGGTAPSGPSGNLSVEQIYRLDAPGVVQINNSASRASAPLRSQALGSGFVIDKAGHIVTSNRVIAGSPGLRVSFSGSDELDATLVGQDPSTDVAVLQVAAHSRSFSPLPLGDSDEVQVGDPVVAIGNTLSLDRTATVGIVSAVQRGIDSTSSSTAAHAIQTDAAINHGNSGGPLINARGQVIGVSSQLGTRLASTDGEGIGFAIPIDTVKAVVAQLLATGKVQHAFLGIGVEPVSTALARAFALPCNYGLIVQNVTPGTGAARAGLQAGSTSVLVAGESYLIGGDIIVAANGTPVTTESQLRDVIETMKPGDRLALRIWSGDKEKTVHVKLGQPPG
ncbi:MAG TPA: trypsin-like peptidase domain-containing protein [Gaiellaceae bacterium]|nr:trypsin-like peptidase domain-containing protein [Gaiellaceae bacterium]